MKNPHGEVMDAERWEAPRINAQVRVPELALRAPGRPAIEQPPVITPRVTGGEQLSLTFRAPQGVVTGITSARTAGDGWSARVDGWTPPRGFLTMPGDGTMETRRAMEPWRIVPPLGESLVIAFDRCDEMPGAANVRGFLTGSTIRVYLATLAAAWDYKARGIAEGSFPWEPTRFGLEYLGLPSRSNTRRPKLRGGDMRDIHEAAKRLARVAVVRVDGTRTNAPEALLAEWTREHDGRKALVHARLVWASMRGKGARYVQVPRATLRVAAEDAPVALGLARFWRSNIIPVALAPQAPGEHRTTLGVLLRELDVDVRAGTRHDGRAFWGRAFDQVQRAATVGALGVVRALSADRGENTPLVVTPTEGLTTAYAPLVRAVEKARALPAG